LEEKLVEQAAKGPDTWLASEPHKLLPQRFGID
jgi:hypothetical protein